MHSLSCDGMDERDGLRLQIQTVSLVAIKFIAQDGTAETLGVRTVHAQLVGPSRMRPQREACHRSHPTPFPTPRGEGLGWGDCHNAVLRNRTLTFLMIDHLTGAIHGITA